MLAPPLVPPTLLTAYWNSDTSVSLSWHPNLCPQYLVLYFSIDGKERILVASGTSAKLTNFEQEIYIAVVVCISAIDEYIVNSYSPLMMKKCE